MRVLVTSTPGWGHVHPMVPIVHSLQRAGHAVTWATAAAMCPTIERFGFAARAAGIDQAERMQRGSAGRSSIRDVPPRERRKKMFARLFAVGAGPPMLADLRAIVDQLQPDLIVHEPCELAAAPLASARGVAHVVVGFGRLVDAAVLDAAAPAIAALWHAVGLEPHPSAGLYDHLYLHPLPPALDALPSVATIRRVRPLGFDGDDAAPAPEWLARSGRERPLVYVTFGTEHAPIAPWSAVVEALRGCDVDAVLTIGPRTDPPGLEHVPSNVRVERYVPQHVLLQRASVLISHGGSGAMIGAAIAGIPQLCLPIAADQFSNAEAVTSAGAGLTLDPHQIDPIAVRGALERLLHDTTLRARSRALRESIAALPHPDEVVPLVERAAEV